MKLKSYPTLEVLAIAVAAYEHNERTIVRNPVTIGGKGYVSNRQIISDYVQGNGGPFIVNDIHRKQADGIVQYLEQTVIMQSLKGNSDNFLSQISAILSNKQTNIKEFGIVAWAPHLVEQYQKKETARELSAHYERTSRFIGTVGSKIEIDFTLIESRYIKNMDCYAVYGHTADNDLVFYWAKDQNKVVTQGKINGRVKSHNVDEFHNKARVTNLNYVKVV